MDKLKKRISTVLVMLFITFTFQGYVPVKAVEVPVKVSFVGVEHSPLVVGDSENFYLSATGAEKVQYRVFQNKIGTDKWEELTSGYTTATTANDITTVKGSAKYELGKYKLSIWVKKADSQGKFKNTTGSYDDYYVASLNCVSKDNNNRVYSNGDMNVEKSNYTVGETVKINGIKDISGMKAPYTYKLHIYDVTNDIWTVDTASYRDKENLTWVAKKPGTYVLDVWAMSSDSTLWNKESSLKGRIYEAWKLKVITVAEKVVEPEVTEVIIKENGVTYGSQDVKNPMQINKNVNIIANDVKFNNANVKGNVTVTGNNATLNNVKIEGNLVLNPGPKGIVNLNDVTANNIQVLSGAADSIHFNNVNANTLNISSNSLVRVESKGTTKIGTTTVQTYAIIDSVSGSFGEITVSIIDLGNNQTQQVVELRGTFTEPIIIESGATLKAAEGAKIPKVIIAPKNNEKITLDGKFGDVEVNKPATVATTANSTIVKVTTNVPTNLELGAGSKVTTVDQKGQVLTQTGTGTVDSKINPPTPPSTGGGGIVTPTTPIPATIDALMNKLVASMQLLPNDYFSVSSYSSPDIYSRNIGVTIKQPSLSLTQLFENKKTTDLTPLLPFATFMADMSNMNINVTTTTGTQTLKDFLNAKRAGTDFAGKTTVELLTMFKGMSYAQFATYAEQYRSKNEDFSINVEGLELTKISAKGITVYDKAAGDKRITLAEVEQVFPGINTGSATLGAFKGTYVVTGIVSNQTVTFTLTVN